MNLTATSCFPHRRAYCTGLPYRFVDKNRGGNYSKANHQKRIILVVTSAVAVEAVRVNCTGNRPTIPPKIKSDMPLPFRIR